MRTTLFAGFASLALASSAALAGGALDATVLSSGQDHRVAVRHLTEKWTWESAPLTGKLVPHGDERHVSVVDLDGDGSDEVVVTLDDQAPGGRVHVFRREAGQQAMAPVMSEVGPGLKNRAFLVWDVSHGASAPVAVSAAGDIRVRARHYGMLGVGEQMATYRYRLQGGIIRLVETVPDPVKQATGPLVR